MTFAEMMMRLHQEAFTGSVIVQFGQGVPSVVEIPQPSTRIRLDKPQRRRADLTALVGCDRTAQLDTL